MVESNFVHKTLNSLLDVIEVELKLPLGIAEIKMSPTAIAREWRENQKKRSDLENAIQRAEDKFVTDHKDQKVAQMLHELPLHSEEEFKQVIEELLTHLSEEKITWLAEVKLIKTWGSIVDAEEIRKALELYLPYLRHELNSIKEFREVISALTLESIDKNTQENVEATRRIESKLDKVLDTHTPKGKEGPYFWFIPHPYPMPPNFTGRAAEQQMLDDWLADDKDRLFILRALGGFGKSALAWQWINTHVNPVEWTKLVWWSFYEGDASFEHFVEETLRYLKLEIPQGQRPQVDELLKAMQEQKILIIMDGFERALRAYSSINAAYQGDEEPEQNEAERNCINIVAEHFLKSTCLLPNFKGKVLMTTRLTPNALERHGQFLLGCLEKELKALSIEDAIAFIKAQGVQGTHAEIENVCESYGYHPLSLCLIAGLIMSDLRNPGDIIVGMRLEITNNIVQNKKHVLDYSYKSLLPKRRKLLNYISCFNSSVEYSTLELSFHSNNDLENDLHDLLTRGLLYRDLNTNRYSLHPIVHRYAYNKLTASQRKTYHSHLREVFASLVYGQEISDIWLAIDLYYQTVLSGKYDTSLGILQQLPRNEFAISLRMQLIHLFGRQANNKKIGISGIIWAYNEEALVFSRIGQPEKAINSLTKLIDIIKYNDEIAYAHAIAALCGQQIELGMFKEAEQNLNTALREIKQDSTKILLANENGKLLGGQGFYTRAKTEFKKAKAVFRKHEDKAGLFQILVDETYISLLHHRAQGLKSNALKTSQNSILEAYKLLNIAEIYDYAIPIQVYWLLGAMHSRYKRFEKAENFLLYSLHLCRQLDFISIEFEINIELARLYYFRKIYDQAFNFAQEALTIATRGPYALRMADIYLFLAQYALEQEKNKTKAKEYAKTALKLATCDGPPYYYKVAYEEAERMLERLKAE
jgi:tetratricopeptide (TPR) repeat protein